MVKYTCECSYSTGQKGDMRTHLNQKKSCTPGKDMKLVDVESLATEGKPRQKLDLTIEQFARSFLVNMTSSSKKRGHVAPTWTREDIIQILQENRVYSIHNTILGTLEFPLALTNSYHNSSSFDRIDDTKGYFKENVEIRPFFLNTQYKLSTDNIRELIHLREIPRNLEEFDDIAQLISNSILSRSRGDSFLNTANSIYQRCEISDRIDFLFDSIEEFMCFLIKQYIDQGLRCAYSNVPIYIEKNHKYKLSVERINPLKNYSKDNVVLIVVGLNGSVCGQFLNPGITDEQRLIALNAAKFNQEYWNKCTKLLDEVSEKCNKAKEHDKQLILEKLGKEVVNRIYNFSPTIIDNVVMERKRANGVSVYRVHLEFDGKSFHFGTYETHELAKIVMNKALEERLIFNKIIKNDKNVDKEKLIKNIKIKIMGEKEITKDPDIPSGITKKEHLNGNIVYIIKVSFANNPVNFGTYSTLDMAKTILRKALDERTNFNLIIKADKILIKQNLLIKSKIEYLI